MNKDKKQEIARLRAEAERLRGTSEDATDVLARLVELGATVPAGQYTVMMRETPVMHARIVQATP